MSRMKKELSRPARVVPCMPFEVWWTEREDRLVKKLYGQLPESGNVLAVRLSRSRNAVQLRAKKLGLTKRPPRRPWTKREIEILKMPISHGAAAKKLKRSRASVAFERWRMKKAD